MFNLIILEGRFYFFYRIKTEYECTISCFKNAINRMNISINNGNLYQILSQFCQNCGDSDLTWDLGRITTEVISSNQRNSELIENHSNKGFRNILDDEIIQVQRCLQKAAVEIIPLLLHYSDGTHDLMYCGIIETLAGYTKRIIKSKCNTLERTDLKYTLIHTVYEISLRTNIPYQSVLACFDQRPRL